jgi:ankyrin repeat protein
MQGKTEVCVALARHGCDLNASDPATGFTALHHAAANDDLALVKALVSLKAKRSLTDFEGRTARDIAEEGGAIDIFDLLALPPVKNAKAKLPR